MQFKDLLCISIDVIVLHCFFLVTASFKFSYLYFRLAFYCKGFTAVLKRDQHINMSVISSISLLTVHSGPGDKRKFLSLSQYVFYMYFTYCIMSIYMYCLNSSFYSVISWLREGLCFANLRKSHVESDFFLQVVTASTIYPQFTCIAA